MESNSVSKDEARAALATVDGIEKKTQPKHTPEWVYAVLGICFGATVAGAIMQWTYWWVLFAVILIACIALAIWDNNRNVRPSMKQPLHDDPQTNWFGVVAPALIMPLIWFVPEGSVVGATIAGIVAAAVTTGLMIYGERNR